MKLEPSLSVRGVAPVLSGLRRLGLDPAPLVARARIDPSTLEDPDARVPMSAVLALLADAGRTTADPNLALHLAEHADLESYDVHFYAMISSPTLGDAYACLPRYQRLIHDASRVELERSRGALIIRHLLHGGGSVPRDSAEFIIASWVRAGRALTGVDWQPREVCFRHQRPVRADEHERWFGCPVSFSAPMNALVLDEPLLALPSRRKDPGLHALVRRHADDLLRTVPHSATMADRIRQVLMERLSAGAPTLDSISDRLHTSASTIRRTLRSEGVTYRELLNGVRHELASLHLARDAMSFADIAFLLGFSELSAFHRAFKRWSGRTPAAFRRQSRRDRFGHHS